MRVAVIDFGKTNVKVAVVDTDRAEEIAVRRLANSARPGPPYPHYDTETHWTFILDALRDLRRDHDIAAISITTHGATAALVGDEGALALPILDYEHDGPDALAKEYDAVRPPFTETGSPRLPMGLNLGAQLFWQFQTFAEARATRHILLYPQYWAYRLCGVPAAEATSLGCHTDLWSPAGGTFSALVDEMGWAQLFPELRKAADTLGTLRPEVVDATGLDPSTPLLCGIHDSNASLYPHLLAREGAFSVVSTGTWVICMAVRGSTVTLDPARDTLTNVNALGEPVPSARFMGGREYESVRAGADMSRTEDERRRVITDRVMLLPAVEVSSGPFRGRRSTWSVEPRSAGERAVALSWYLALMTGTCLSLIGADGPIVVEGPFARNGDYLDMLQACTGRPVEPASGSVTGTSVGAAMLVNGRPSARDERKPRRSDIDAELRMYAEDWFAAVGQD
jgi:sugar (pentulose or hexulose) kinase